MSCDILIKKREENLIKELNSLPKTQLVLRSGATAKMLNVINETNELRKDDLLAKNNTKLIKSIRGLHLKNNNKFNGIFEIVRLSRKLMRDQEQKLKENEKSSSGSSIEIMSVSSSN